uniref:Uncharacterized protein n=1 Tax=Siphoviridae sp. ctLfk13 TaxID=2826251 RepID=A0A8S5N1Q5_9CAUD|nr:MAG TPA: hypothetical protein [Siphoviridae sp. ctLfk13]
MPIHERASDVCCPTWGKDNVFAYVQGFGVCPCRQGAGFIVNSESDHCFLASACLLILVYRAVVSVSTRNFVTCISLGFAFSLSRLPIPKD